MAHFFAPPVPPHLQQIHPRLNVHRARRKRKHESEHEPELDDEDDEDHDGRGVEPPSGKSQNDDSARETAMSTSLGAQSPSSDAGDGRRTHKSPSPQTPPYPWPHAATRSKVLGVTHSRIQRELADLNPPLYPTTTVEEGSNSNEDTFSLSNLRRHHLAVLTTILHRCLLESDYARASRAWSLLLRSRIDGKPVEIRRDGRWGIGAEILLQRHHGHPSANKKISDQDNGQDKETSQDTIEPLFTEEGFRSAREYYERLILQYSEKGRAQKSAVNATKFYPAMFSLWIYEVCERIKRAKLDLDQDTSSPSTSPQIPHDESFDPDISLDMQYDRQSRLAKNREEQLAQINAMELAGAREIAERLDRLLSSPPYDNDVNILELRGMVHVWIGDLLVNESPVELSADNRSDSGSITDQTDDNGPSSRTVEHQQRQTELERAQTMFERARKHGSRLDPTVSNPRQSKTGKGI